MKTTVKLGNAKSMTVQPCKTGGVIVEFNNPNALFVVASNFTLQLTPDQAGALIFGLEQAAEAAQIAQDRAAA